MPSEQGAVMELRTLRKETAGVLADAVEGERGKLPHAWASQISRYLSLVVGNPLEFVATLLMRLSRDRGAAILAYLESVYEQTHGRQAVVDLHDAIMAKHEADCEEDMLRGRLRKPDGQWCDATLREWVRRARRERVRLDGALRSATYHLARDRKGTRRAGGRSQSMGRAS